MNTASEMAMVDFHELGRRYGSHWALESASGAGYAGKITALTGENGSGKSTLLLVLGGVLRQHKGSLTFNTPTRHLVAHHAMAYADLSIEANLHLAATLTDSTQELIPDALDYWQISDLSKKPIRTLSRGQLQRFLLARAKIAQARILLLDEPFSGLDTRSERRLIDFMLAQKMAGNAVIFSEHDPVRARELSDANIRMAAGRTLP